MSEKTEYYVCELCGDTLLFEEYSKQENILIHLLRRHPRIIFAIADGIWVKQEMKVQGSDDETPLHSGE